MADIVDYDTDIAHAPHQLKVVGYSPMWAAHECVIGERRVWVDLFVAGTLPTEMETADLIGKTVEVDYAHGFIWIGQGVRIVEEASNEGP